MVSVIGQISLYYYPLDLNTLHDEGSLFNHAGRGRHHRYRKLLGVFARDDPTSKISEIHYDAIDEASTSRRRIVKRRENGDTSQDHRRTKTIIVIQETQSLRAVIRVNVILARIFFHLLSFDDHRSSPIEADIPISVIRTGIGDTRILRAPDAELGQRWKLDILHAIWVSDAKPCEYLQNSCERASTLLTLFRVRHFIIKSNAPSVTSPNAA